MAIFEWNNGEVPENLKVTQVYGLVFCDDGRMILRVVTKNGKKIFSLAGGTPESFDENREATLRRELIEEINTTLKEKVIMVGYQKVDEQNGIAPYAQVRMTAIIDKIGPILPDPDNGETYERLLTTPQHAIELLNWGEVAEKQINEAVKIAKLNFEFGEISTMEEYI